MALVIADRVRETTTTTGTGAVTLAGAATGCQTFSSAIGNGNTTYYTIADQGGPNWEVGLGTYSSSGNTLARTTVLSSSNAGSLVTFTAGTKDVFVTYPAEVALYSGGDLGTPSSGTLTNCTFPNASTSVFGAVKVDGTTITASSGVISAVGGGSGSVTSVAMTVPTFLSVAGSPITSSGTLAVTLSGTALPVANGGTGVTTSTGSGDNVLATSPTLVTPILGTPTSGDLTNCTFPVASTSVSGTVKVDGTTITISGGVISSTGGYTLPTASTSVLGGVKVDGTTITINGSGVISSSGGGGGISTGKSIALTFVLGG